MEKSWLSTIIEVKRIHENDLKLKLRNALLKISEVLNFKDNLDTRRRIKFEENDPDFWSKLEIIWNHFLPHKEYKRYTDDWQKIGFQGANPYTDLRAAGLLWIDNFVYFCENHSESSSKWLGIASAEQNFFFFAVTGIYATLWAIDIIDESKYFEFLLKKSCDFSLFDMYQETFWHMMIKFTYHWSSVQRDIMDFPAVNKEFKEIIKNQLGDLTNLVARNLTERKKDS